jgi:NADPH:quinone reductase-like Zn-dependent oxidoreductase
MKAIVQDRYGAAPADVLRLADVARPTIGDDEILVRVRAASVDRGTWHLMAGLPYPIRVAGAGLRSLGADHVIDYTLDDFADGEHHYDAILDIGGNNRLSHLRRALTPRGRLVIVGGETDGRWFGGTDRQVRAILLSPLVSQRLGTFVATENAKDLAALRELVESGKLTPAIDRTYPLSETPAAIRYLQEGHARGKVVIVV